MATSLEDLTTEQIETIETLVGLPLNKFGEATSMGKVLAAMAFVVKQSEDPTFTYEDARKLTIREVNALVSFQPEPDAD